MESDGYRVMKRLLTVRPRIDAVFAANDPAAIGAMKAIWEAGCACPTISRSSASATSRSATAARAADHGGLVAARQGRHAAELLLNGLDHEADEPQRIIIPPRLIVRESSGVPR